MNEIKRAIRAFGERNENITVKGAGDFNTVVVYVDSEYYGIYDFAKNTFVD